MLSKIISQLVRLVEVRRETRRRLKSAGIGPVGYMGSELPDYTLADHALEESSLLEEYNSESAFHGSVGLP
ncbi:MAG: hypothetical protein OXN96_03350 [Bryobacterales bacterium]|nr:hypothetical protein [Bryobacterales bacterium]